MVLRTIICKYFYAILIVSLLWPLFHKYDFFLTHDRFKHHDSSSEQQKPDEAHLFRTICIRMHRKIFINQTPETYLDAQSTHLATIKE